MKIAFLLMAESTYHINEYTSSRHISDSVNDFALVIAFNSNDHCGFTGIYNRLFPSVFYFARRLVGHEEALDKTAETFYKLWRMEKSFASLQSIKTWCQVTVRNDCINFLRRQTMRQSEEDNIAGLHEIVVESYEDSLVVTELMHLLQQQIESLPAQCKKVFKMSYLDQLREKQIASQLQLSVNTVRNHKARALKLLKLALPKSLMLLAYLKIFFPSIGRNSYLLCLYYVHQFFKCTFL